MPIRNINIRRLLLAAAVLCVSLLLVSSPHQSVFASPSRQTTQVLAPLDDFQRVDGSRGWVLTGGQLFWTANQSAGWIEITPPDAGALRAAFFVDRGLGFAVAETFSGDQVSFFLYTTTNQGADWQRAPLASYPITDPRAAVSRVHLQFLNQDTGWVVLKRATSINFNLGTVFRTSNGGSNWAASAGPAGEAVYFYDASVGFMTGGPNKNILYRTVDGGRTWSPTDLNFSYTAMTHLPNFLLPELGHAAVVTTGAAGTRLTIYQTADLGASWTEAASADLSAAEDLYPIVGSAPGEIKAFAAAQRLIFWQTTGQLETRSLDQAENFTQVDFADANTGWALANRLTCQTEGDPNSCSASQALLQTADGGLSWQALAAPQVYLQVPEETDLKFAREIDYHRDRTAVWTGQGVDMCDITTASNLQKWKTSSPFSAVNLYIGGVARACNNNLLTKPLIESLSLQGWKFIPTWVGPQASCTTFSKVMSSDPKTARQQGIDNAIDASAVLEQSGLGGVNGAGSVVYYDLEGFPYNSNPQCLAAAKAFIDGWVWQLHENGITAGLYGSSCASALSQFYNIDNPPDVIWPASWYSNYYYRSFETTDNIGCIPDTQWGNHQRILQYTGAHNETWGGVTLNVDLNAIDGVVADITGVTSATGAPAAKLLNASFEDGVLPPWQVDLNETACDSSVVNDSNTAHFGNHYLALSNSGNPECVGVSQPITFTPASGEQYRFAVWARSSSASDLRSIRLLLTANGLTPTATNQPFSGIGEDWVCLEVAHTINRTDHTAITPSVLLDDADGIEVFLDAAQFTRNTGSLCPTTPIPSGMRASDAGDQTRVILQWDSVSGATFYKVYKSSTPTSPRIYLDRSLTNKFIETTLPAFETAYYSVQACNAGGCSNFSSRDAGSLADPNLDFFDGFEDGDLNRWDLAVNSPASLYACSAGSLNGAYGLCVNADLTSSAILVHNLSAPTRDLELNFTFDPNGADLGNQIFNLVKFIDTVSVRQALTIQVVQANSGYRVRIGAQEDSGNQINTGWVNIPDQPTEITLKWWSTIGQLRSTSGGFSGASLQINGVQVGELTGMSNHNLVVDRIVAGGLINAAPSGANGTYFLDDINYNLPLFLRPNQP